jgi:6-phosphogluconate dehydrogenase
MVHNGIEYAEMQLIAEIYSILHYVFHLRPDDIANELESWNQTEQQSYLLKITADILRHTENDILTLDTILDVANHKGTGSWTTIAACELGVPIPTLTAALYARFTSTYKAFRVATEPVYRALFEQRTSSMPPNLQNIYGVARIINHIQGFQLIEKASVHYDWGINISDIAKIWTNGCIIQSTLLSELSDILKDHGPTIAHPKIAQRLQPVIPEFGWFLSKTISGHLPLPCMESAWTYLKSFAQKESPANLIQAQRDYFGAHTYRLKDNPEGPAMHTYWQKNTF